MKGLKIPQHRIQLIDFTNIYSIVISKTYSDIQWFLDLNCNNNKLIKPVKLFLLNNLIFEMCECVINSKGNDRVVFYVTNLQSSLDCFFKQDELKTFINKTLIQISNKLPLKIVFTKHCNLLEQKTQNSLSKVEIHNIVTLCNVDTDKFYFSQIKHFAKSKGLKFLNEEYFNKLRFSHILFK